MIDEHLDRVEQRMLSTHRGHDFLAPIIRSKVGSMPLNDGIAQFRGAGHGRVFRKIRLDRGDGRILNMLGRGKVRLSGAKVHHIDALAAQLVGLGHNGHGGGGLNPVDAFGQLDGVEGFGRCHAFFLALDFRVSDLSCLAGANSASLYAGSSLPRRFCSTSSGTSPFTEPPSCATSRTSRELR